MSTLREMDIKQNKTKSVQGNSEMRQNVLVLTKKNQNSGKQSREIHPSQRLNISQNHK